MTASADDVADVARAIFPAGVFDEYVSLLPAEHRTRDLLYVASIIETTQVSRALIQKGVAGYRLPKIVVYLPSTSTNTSRIVEGESAYFVLLNPGFMDHLDYTTWIYADALDRISGELDNAAQQRLLIRSASEIRWYGHESMTLRRAGKKLLDESGFSDTARSLARTLIHGVQLYVMAHEVGHAVLGHLDSQPSGNEQAAHREIAADRFAAGVYNSIGLKSPVGVRIACALVLAAMGDANSPSGGRESHAAHVTMPLDRWVATSHTVNGLVEQPERLALDLCLRSLGQMGQPTHHEVALLSTASMGWDNLSVHEAVRSVIRVEDETSRVPDWVALLAFVESNRTRISAAIASLCLQSEDAFQTGRYGTSRHLAALLLRASMDLGIDLDPEIVSECCSVAPDFRAVCMRYGVPASSLLQFFYPDAVGVAPS